MNYSYISNDGHDLFLHRYGHKIRFTSTTSCTTFLQAISGGRSTIIETISKDGAFVDIAIGDTASATAIVDEYFGQQAAFYLIGSADDFIAGEHGAESLEGAFPALSGYVTAILGFAPLEKTLELTSDDPKHAEKIAKAFEDLHAISQVKRDEWLSQHAAVRAKRESKDPLPISKPNGAAMWSITTFNATGGQQLTYDGKLPITMVDTYVIVQQPSPSFTQSSETLAWYTEIPWFAYGGNGAGMKWRTITGRTFGVGILVPMVYFGVGSDPYYQVWRDDFENWVVPPGGPSAPYEFPGGWGYNVKVVPTSLGKELFVQAHVQKEKAVGTDDELTA